MDHNFIVIGDLHFKGSEENVRRSTPMCEDILSICTDKEPEFIVVLGDTLHTFNIIRGTVLRRASDFIIQLSKIAHVYLLIGNHDIPNNKSYPPINHAFTAFNACSDVTVVDAPTEISRKCGKFLAVPYIPTGMFSTVLEEYDLSTYDALFAHQEFKGCTLSPGKVSEDGDERPKAKLIISGHLHEHHIVGNVNYVGTPVQHTHAEGTDKAITMFSPYCETSERLRLPNVPQKISVCVKYSDLNKLKSRKLTKDTRVCISCTNEEMAVIQLHKMVIKMRKIGCPIKYDRIDSKKRVEKYTGTDSFSTLLNNKIPKNLKPIYNELFGTD